MNIMSMSSYAEARALQRRQHPYAPGTSGYPTLTLSQHREAVKWANDVAFTDPPNNSMKDDVRARWGLRWQNAYIEMAERLTATPKGLGMPFQSEAQRRLFYAKAARGEIPMKTVRKWQRETKGKKLPERLRGFALAGLGQTPALIILQQLGGNHFLQMTGAQPMTDGPNKLILKLKRPAKVKAFAVTYEPGRDTYKVEAYTQKGAPTFAVKMVYEADDVYAENLRDIFKRVTGIDRLSLF